MKGEEYDWKRLSLRSAENRITSSSIAKDFSLGAVLFDIRRGELG